MASRRRAKSRGTTLLDVLVAAAIMLVLFAIGVPNLSRLRSPYALAGATRQIAADLQAARQRAIARNVRHRGNFDAAHASYTIEREQAGNRAPDPAPQPVPAGPQPGPVRPGTPASG